MVGLINKYVVGFLFDIDFKKVLLIKKNRPEQFKGLLNGVGGHVENDETEENAISREFEEETGYYINPESWYNFICVTGEDFLVNYYFTCGDLNKCKQTTDEELLIVNINELHLYDIVDDIKWLVMLATDENLFNYKNFEINPVRKYESNIL